MFVSEVRGFCLMWLCKGCRLCSSMTFELHLLGDQKRQDSGTLHPKPREWGQDVR